MVGEEMNIKVGDAVTAFHAINNIFAQRVPMRAKEAYWLGRNQDELEKVWKDYNKQMIKVIEDHGGKIQKETNQITLEPTIKSKAPNPEDPEGEQIDIDIPNPAMGKCKEESDKLFLEEVDVTINKISIAGFTQMVIACDMKAISFMIDAGEGDPQLVVVPGGDFAKRLKQ